MQQNTVATAIAGNDTNVADQFHDDLTLALAQPRPAASGRQVKTPERLRQDTFGLAAEHERVTQVGSLQSLDPCSMNSVQRCSLWIPVCSCVDVQRCSVNEDPLL